ncbi:hypothetical protein R6Q59_001789 [Mikania micrantha]
MDIDSMASISPMKIQSTRNCLMSERSLLEALPLEVLVLCGLEYDDLNKLFHVSKPIREALSHLPSVRERDPSNKSISLISTYTLLLIPCMNTSP